MKSYWEYSDKERASLTSEDIEPMLGFELMEKGVIKPKQPTLLPVVDIDLGPKQTVYAIVSTKDRWSVNKLDCVFSTMEQAHAFLALNPMKRDTNYEIGSEKGFVKPLTDLSIQPEEVFDVNRITSAMVQLKKNKANQDANEKALAAITKANEAAEKVTEGVWTDWHRCRELDSENRAIVARLDEYEAMTGGDENVAMKFLYKLHTASEINNALQWCDREPYVEHAECVPIAEKEVV